MSAAMLSPEVSSKQLHDDQLVPLCHGGVPHQKSHQPYCVTGSGADWSALGHRDYLTATNCLVVFVNIS